MDHTYRRMQAMTTAATLGKRGETHAATIARAEAFLHWVSQEESLEEKIRHLSPRSQAWLKKYPEVVSNPGLYDAMRQAALSAYHSGIVTDSDAYFAFVEQKIGLGKRNVISLAGDEA